MLFFERGMQSFNLAGVNFFFSILACHSLAIPHIEARDLRGINPERLLNAGIKGVVFDKDNTLTEPYKLQIVPEIAGAVEKFKRTFGRNVIILSNSAGTLDDYNSEKAEGIEKALGIHVLRHEQKKPGRIPELEDYFGCKLLELVIIGDRYFTDVAYGNRHGMFTAHVQPFTNRGGNFAVRAIRPLETELVNLWRNKRAIAPEHAAFGIYF